MKKINKLSFCLLLMISSLSSCSFNPFDSNDKPTATPFLYPEHISLIGNFKASNWINDIDFKSVDGGHNWFLNNFLFFKGDEWILRQNYNYKDQHNGNEWGFNNIVDGKELVNLTNDNACIKSDGMYNISFNFDKEEISIKRIRDFKPLKNPFINSSKIDDKSAIECLDNLLRDNLGDEKFETLNYQCDFEEIYEDYFSFEDSNVPHYFHEDIKTRVSQNLIKKESYLDYKLNKKDELNSESRVIDSLESIIKYDESKGGFIEASTYNDQKVYSLIESENTIISYQKSLNNSKINDYYRNLLSPKLKFGYTLSSWLKTINDLKNSEVIYSYFDVYKVDYVDKYYFDYKMLNNRYELIELSFITLEDRPLEIFESFSNQSGEKTFKCKYKYDSLISKIPEYNLDEFTKIAAKPDYFIDINENPLTFINDLNDNFIIHDLYKYSDFHINYLYNDLDKNNKETSLIKESLNKDAHNLKLSVKHEEYDIDPRGNVILNNNATGTVLINIYTEEVEYLEVSSLKQSVLYIENYFNENKEELLNQYYLKALENTKLNRFDLNLYDNELKLLNDLLKLLNDSSYESTLKYNKDEDSYQLVIKNHEYLCNYIIKYGYIISFEELKYSGENRYHSLLNIDTESNLIIGTREIMSNYYGLYY